MAKNGYSRIYVYNQQKFIRKQRTNRGGAKGKLVVPSHRQITPIWIFAVGQPEGFMKSSTLGWYK